MGAKAKIGMVDKAVIYGLAILATSGEYHKKSPIKAPLTVPSTKPLKASKNSYGTMTKQFTRAS